MTASARHEELVKAKVEELEKEEWRVVTIGNCHPDAIATKNGIIMAVDIVKKYRHTTSRNGRSRGWKYGGSSLKDKIRRYSRFDKIAFVTFYSTGEIAEQFVIDVSKRMKWYELEGNLRKEIDESVENASERK